jgi:hypothetical protein
LEDEPTEADEKSAVAIFLRNHATIDSAAAVASKSEEVLNKLSAALEY